MIKWIEVKSKIVIFNDNSKQSELYEDLIYNDEDMNKYDFTDENLNSVSLNNNNSKDLRKS